MKHLILSCFFLNINLNSFCQDSNLKMPIEIGFDINYLIDNNQVETKTGFGLFIKRIWYPDKNLNLVSGLIFEKTKYFDDYVQCGHYCHYKDIKFSIYAFSIPLMLRANTGNRYKIFIETGPSFELIPFKYGKGIEVTYSPMSNIKETEISSDFEHDLTDFGANIGIGLILPLGNYILTVSSNYHSSISSITEKQQNDLTKYFSLNIGIFIN